MIWRARPLRQLWRADDGAALVEFALVAPVFIMSLLAIFDLCYNIYAASMLEGVIQKSARDTSLETGYLAEDTIDTRVRTAVQAVMPRAEITFDRKAYTNFSDVGRAEDFTDLNENGRCDDGEPFEDVNGNKNWDADRGEDGFGGARDAVLYTVSITYERVFPLAKMLGMDNTVSATTRTVLRNQPFGQQTTNITIQNCPR